MMSIRELLDHDVIWCPGLNGGVALTLRGGDFELHVGQDATIGYDSHTPDQVALYFLETARTAGDVYDVLGDPVLRRVVTGALGLPDQIAIQPVETQGRAVTARLKVTALQDERQVRKLAERYLIAAANQAAGAAAGRAGDPITAITGLSLRT